ncbi:MAG: flippase activity-associated protein Agl23 [Myxococcota bacterium]|nr:flippase activity-associated protein Agl23 [Myxococcota bacterium]
MRTEGKRGSVPWSIVLLVAGILVVTTLALALRLPGLADKPLHSDEGVNGWFSLRLYWWNVYRYQPADYHGPFLYYVNLVLFWLFGPSDVSLRLGTALFGGCVPLLLWPLRRWIGGVGVLVAGLLLACSPGMVYFSRTVIHEIYLVFFTVLWVVALISFLRRPGWTSGLVASLACLGAFCNKETAILTLGSLGCGFLLAWLAGRRRDDGPGLLEPDLFGGRDRLAQLHSVCGARWRVWLAGVALFFVGIVLFFSSFFSYTVGEKLARKMAPLPEWFVGVGGFFRAFLPWFDHGSSGRNQGKDWDYFLGLMVEHTEGLALGLGLAAAVLALVLRHRLGLFLVGWAASSFTVYSLIPYKTPWCVLSIDLAVFILCGWGAGQCIFCLRDPGSHPLVRGLALLPVLVVLLPVAHFAETSLKDNAERYDDPDLPYVYVQTQRGFHDLIRDHLGVAAADPEGDGLGPRVENINGKNPTRWYTITRGWDHERTRYWAYDDPKDSLPSARRLSKAQIVVSVGLGKRGLEARLEETGLGWHREVYPLRPGWRITSWYRQELWDRYQAKGGRQSEGASLSPSASIHEPPKPERYLTSRERKQRQKQ